MNRDGKQALNAELRTRLPQEVIDKIIAPVGLDLVARMTRAIPHNRGSKVNKAMLRMMLDALERSTRDRHLDVAQKQQRRELSRAHHNAEMTVAGIDPSDQDWCRSLSIYWFDGVIPTLAMVAAEEEIVLNPTNSAALSWGVLIWALRVVEQADAPPQPLPLPAVGDATHET